MASAKRTKQRQRRLIQEGAATLEQVRGDLVALDEASVRSDGTVPIRLISPGAGSSGYYSPDVLEAAGTDRIFARGTQMYWDHPSATERSDRPERSLRDLAAVLETDGVWQADNPAGPGIYAQAKVFEAFRPLLAEMAPHIGVSIRAAAEIGSGEINGKRTRVVERLVEAVSVDFVTKAGRGGAVLAVLEAAGRTDLIDTVETVGDWIQRTATAAGVAPALEAFTETIEKLAPELLTRDLWTDPDSAATQTTESQEDTMTPEEIKETVAAAVKAEVTPIQTELTETKTKLEATQAELDAEKKKAAAASEALLLKEARDHVEANDKVKALPAIAREAVIGTLVHEAAATDGKLDVTALDEATTKAVDAKVAELAEAAGSPVRGAGGSDTTTAIEADEAINTRLEETFKRLGSSDTAAKVAVAGRS